MAGTIRSPPSEGDTVVCSAPGCREVETDHDSGKEKKFQKQRANSQKDDYKKHANGTVSGGKDLQSSAIYPLKFCKAVFADA